MRSSAASSAPLRSERLYRPLSLVDAVAGFDEAARRRVMLVWLVGALVFVPSGMVTRLLEWTGIPVSFGDTQVFITVYVPMIFCTLCVMWLGYAWGAVPAYLSTFCVALLGGVPIEWALLFSFANPLGLAIFTLAYRAIPIRTDLRSVPSFLFFLLTAFVAALVGSSGSFVWGYTNEVGLHELMPVWQGWWVGGFVQTVLFVAPILALAGPAVERWKAEHGLGNAAGEALSRSRLITAFMVVVAALAGYVALVRYFSLLQLAAPLALLDGSTAEAIRAAFEGLALIHWVTLFLIVLTGVFGYQVVVHWTAALRASTEALSRLNQKLTDEIAERRHVEVQLQEHAERLRHAVNSKDRFFSIISHDLRSPLATVLAVSQTLVEEYDEMDSELVLEFVKGMNVSSAHLHDLLENLLTWSQLQTGGMQHRPERTEVAALVAGVVALLAPNAAEKGIRLRTDVASGLVAWADPNMIRSVVLNLLSNATKFTPAGGEVVLTAAQEHDRVALTVRDTGVGMDVEQLDSLFRVETAFSTAGTDDEKGSGLGLILCYEMVAHHGSELTVSSELGEGTVFAFDLPMAPVEAPVEPAEEISAYPMKAD